MAVRSKRLASGILGGDAVVYTAPAGETVLIKQVMFTNEGGGPVTVQFRLRIAGIQRTLRREVIAQAVSIWLEPFLVLQPADDIVILAAGNLVSLHYYLGGAELEGVAD